MKLVRTIEEVRSAVRNARRSGATIAFVPTMGYLHEGHLSLVRMVREQGAEFVAASIFVNPLQFGPKEDFTTYPRDEERDAELLERAGVDLVFLPSLETMYPDGATTTVRVGGVSAPLEGERRPGHFDGVATVVAKLFHIVEPDIAAFGRKDAQQCAVIEKMVRDLDFPLRLVFGETVREADGLAKSSRNSYLSPEERAKAPVLHRALRAGESALMRGERDVPDIEKRMRGIVDAESGVTVDYLSLVDPLTFEAPRDFDRDLLVAGAVRIGRTRLIDNIRIPRS
jgi:pantoate--beta-alanine ligase